MKNKSSIKIEALSSSEKISDWRQKLNNLITTVNKLSGDFEKIKISEEKNDFVFYPLSLEKGGTGGTSAKEAIDNILPSQKGNSEKFLKTNGTDVEWVALPLPKKLGELPGILSVSQGGTGVSSITEARKVLFPSKEFGTNSFLYIDDTGNVSCLPLSTIIVDDDKVSEKKDSETVLFETIHSIIEDRLLSDIDFLKERIDEIETIIKSPFSGMSIPYINGDDDILGHIELGDFGKELLSLSSKKELESIFSNAFQEKSVLLSDIEKSFREPGFSFVNEEGGIEKISFSDIQEEIIGELPEYGDFFESLKDIVGTGKKEVIVLNEHGEVETAHITKKGFDLIAASGEKELQNIVFGEDDYVGCINKSLELTKTIDFIPKNSLLTKNKNGNLDHIKISETARILLECDSISKVKGALEIHDCLKFTDYDTISAGEKIITDFAIGRHDFLRASHNIQSGANPITTLDFSEGVSHITLNCGKNASTTIVTKNEIPPKVILIIKTQHSGYPPVIKWHPDHFIINDEGIDISHPITYVEFIRLDDDIAGKRYLAPIIQKGFDLPSK